MTALSHIRNFSIVAHIDHGKSTLADRLIQETGTVKERDMQAQMLDSMDIERERGITIKANTVRIDYTALNGESYVLNLIDTPGHVDFAYEVSRSMRAVEGSLLVVDSTQGVEAQTLANVYHAIDANHEIVPILNKIDLPATDCDRVAEQIEDVIGIDASQAVMTSAKSGIGTVPKTPLPSSFATCTRGMRPAERTRSNTCWRSGRSASDSGGIIGPQPSVPPDRAAIRVRIFSASELKTADLTHLPH